jgi:chaperonin GroEL
VYKKIVDKAEMKEAIKIGMAKIAGIVKVTLGPGGLPVLLQRQGQALNGDPLSPILTKDGVSVAEECSDEDENIDLVIQSVKDICKKTNQTAGDGPQPLHSKVLTPNGFILMKDVKKGTIICGTNGSLQKVLEVFPKGQKTICKVKFSDGRVVECCEDHLWEVTTNYGVKKTLPLKELMKDLVEIQPDGYPKYKYYTPNNVVEFESNKNNMPLDPYLVGLLLGDGSLSGTGTIELSLGKNKEHILNKINLPVGLYLDTKYNEDKHYFRVKIQGKTAEGKKIENYISDMGLLGVRSSTKHIPKDYLYSNKKDREKLLQGLLDTDGYINSRNRFEFSTISPNLANDFTALVRSLGKHTTISIHTREKDLNSYSNTPIFRMYERKGYKNGIKIVEVEVTDKTTEMQCIKVSNPDNLYITDDFIVTHNTTSAIVLGEALTKTTAEFLAADTSLNPQLIKESIEEASKKVLALLDKEARKVNSTKVIGQIATISANGETEIGDLIKEAFDKVGEDGVITVDEGKTTKNTITIIEGYQFKRGAEAQNRFFNNKENNRFEAENCHVIIYNGHLMSSSKLVPAFQTIAENTDKGFPPVLVIADEFSQEVIMWLLIQRAQAGLSVCAVKSPHVTSVRMDTMDDIAIITGGERLGQNTRDLETVTLNDIGIVNKVVVDKYATTLYEGHGTEENIIKRIDQLKAQKEGAESVYDAQVIADRIAALSNGIALIGVGGTTDIEIKERYHRIEDALNAARAAMEEGYIPGGGIVLAQIADRLNGKKATIGEKILAKALKAPFLQICENIGENGADILKKVLRKRKQNKNLTYNARTKNIEDALKAGIIDPTKVTKTALSNAVSIAALLSTCGGGIVYSRKKT